MSGGTIAHDFPFFMHRNKVSNDFSLRQTRTGVEVFPGFALDNLALTVDEHFLGLPKNPFGGSGRFRLLFFFFLSPRGPRRLSLSASLGVSQYAVVSVNGFFPFG